MISMMFVKRRKLFLTAQPMSPPLTLHYYTISCETEAVNNGYSLLEFTTFLL
jgi:hypothetical protein